LGILEAHSNPAPKYGLWVLDSAAEVRAARAATIKEVRSIFAKSLETEIDIIWHSLYPQERPKQKISESGI
jgi:lambda repressor-like predicted transcriptional regulator